MIFQIVTVLSNFQWTCLVWLLTLCWTHTKVLVLAYPVKDYFSWSLWSYKTLSLQAQVASALLIRKIWFMLSAVRIFSYICTRKVWRTLQKLKLLSAAPRATFTLLSCSPNYPCASTTRYVHAKQRLAWTNSLMSILIGCTPFTPCDTLLLRSFQV